MDKYKGAELLLNFNCTIQELKLPSKPSIPDPMRFQLHHTGIKMYPLYYFQKLTTSFGVIWLVF